MICDKTQSLESGKRYLIIMEQEKGKIVCKMAYWFDLYIRTVGNLEVPYPAGFYRTPYRRYSYTNVLEYWALDNQSRDCLNWTNEAPIEGERYLVYRVGSYGYGHYTVRRYHNGSFGSVDVKYWTRLDEFFEAEEITCGG